MLLQELEKSKKFQELLETIKKQKGPVAISGLVDVEKVRMVTTISKKSNKPICILTYN